MKGRKAFGEDGVAKEMLRTLQSFSTKNITSIANKIYKSGEVMIRGNQYFEIYQRNFRVQ